VNLQVFGWCFAFARDFFKFGDLPLIKVAQPGSLDSRDVDEYGLAASLGLNKSVAF
jgi:hypothetical protein